MPKIICVLGIPSSGKSTLTKRMLKEREHRGVVWVNKDNLRQSCHAGRYSTENEVFIKKMQRTLIEEALRSGNDVIVDDSGLLNSYNMEVIESIAAMMEAEIVIDRSCMTVPLEECIRRDNLRQNGVGESVVKKFFDRHIGFPLLPFESEKQDAIILDIDGCAASYNPLLDEEFGDVHMPIWLMVRNSSASMDVIVVTGREDKGNTRANLEKWLTDNNWRTPVKIFMRPEGDRSSSKDLKTGIVREHILPLYNVIYALDDDESVISGYQAMGIDTIQPKLRN